MPPSLLLAIGLLFSMTKMIYSISNQLSGYILEKESNKSEDVVSIQNRNLAPKIPVNYFLSQNFPNTCNSTTSITFSLPFQQIPTLKVYDIQGCEVAVLVNEVK